MESLIFPLLPVRFPSCRGAHLDFNETAYGSFRISDGSPSICEALVMLRSYSIAIEYIPTIQDTSWHAAVR